MDIGLEMLFETTIRTFLGDKAFHIAGQVHDDKSRKNWYKKAIKKVIIRTHLIDTSLKHKEQLEFWSSKLLQMLSTKDFSEKEFSLYLLRFVGALLGFLSIRGSVLASPAYFQTASQYYTQAIFAGGDVMQDYYDSKSTTAIRSRLASQLKSEGYNDFQISLVLNISEYEVKRLRAEL